MQAETESTPQDPPTHNPPNQMPQENPKPGSSTDFAVVIKDEPDVRVVKQERETTANVCGMEAANESLSAVQPFHRLASLEHKPISPSHRLDLLDYGKIVSWTPTRAQGS